MYLYCFTFVLVTTPVTSVNDTTSSNDVTPDNPTFTYNHIFICNVHPNSTAEFCEVTCTVKDNGRMAITSNE